MGRQRINQLLAQLEENRQRDIESTAAVFTVAQVLLNEAKARIDALEMLEPGDQ